MNGVNRARLCLALEGKTTKRLILPIISDIIFKIDFKRKLFTFVSNVDSLDWKDNATPDSICNRVTSKVKNGSIILFHNDADHTPAALPNILKCLKDEGYEFVFIEDLIYKENYEIIHDGTQCKIENDN